MAGLFKRLTDVVRTAKAVKDELEASGVLDREREEVPAAAQEPAPAGARSAGFALGLERGCVDPLSLITQSEASAAFGFELGPPDEWYSEDSIGAELRSPDGRDYVAVRLFYARDENGRPTAATTWESLLRQYPSRASLGGLGDEAFEANGIVFVRKGDQVLYVDGSVPAGVEAVAPIAAGRL